MFKAWFLSSAGALGQAPHLSEPRFPDSYNGYVGYFRSACITELSRGFDKMCDALAHHLTGTTHTINTSCRHHDHCSRSQYWAQIPGAGREQCVCVSSGLLDTRLLRGWMTGVRSGSSLCP